MNKKKLTRRQFLTTASVGTIAAAASRAIPVRAQASKEAGKLAVLGGQPVRTKRWPSWPVWIGRPKNPFCLYCAVAIGLEAGEKLFQNSKKSMQR